MSSNTFVFQCNSNTYIDCVEKNVFGTNKPWSLEVKEGDYCLLHHYELGSLLGLWKATSNGGGNLVPKVWGGKFPFQVKVKLVLPRITDVSQKVLMDLGVNPAIPVIVTNDGEEVSIDDEGFSIFDLYRYLHDRRKREIMQRVKQKEREFTECLEGFKKLTNQRAIDQANAEMDRIDREISSLRQQLEPLDENTKDASRELNRMSSAATRARAALGEANYRRKSEALTGIIDRIECSFRLNDVKAANRPKSLLETIEIIPVTGDPVPCYPNGFSVARD